MGGGQCIVIRDLLSCFPGQAQTQTQTHTQAQTQTQTPTQRYKDTSKPGYLGLSATQGDNAILAWRDVRST